MRKTTKFLFAALAIKKVIVLSMLYAASADAQTIPMIPPPIPVPAQDFKTYGQGIPLPEFLKITLKGMANRAYVLSPEVSQSNLYISADFSQLKLKDPLPLVREILAGLDLTIREVSSVLIIEKKKESDAQSELNHETFIYKPKHRTIGSLSSYFNLFNNLKFSFGAGISVRSAAPTNSAGASSSSTPAGQAPSPSLDSGATTFSSQDKDPTFLVVRGTSADIVEFKDFLSQVDTQVPEVLLRAFVFEVRDSTNKDSAVQLVMNLLNDSKITLGAASNAPEVFRLSFSSLSLAVNALTSDSRVKLLSSPTLRAADGTTAVATIGTDTPTLGSIITQNGSAQQSITYQSAGVLLSVSPRVLDETIRLTISQELSSFVKTETGLSSTPTKLRRAFKSDVIAKHGEALLLGGLSETQQSSAKQKSLFFFGSDSESESSSEIVVLIQVEKI